MRPVVFDGFCGAGGSAKGWQRAGFHVVGIDIEPQPDYCGDEFIQADVLDVLAANTRYFDVYSMSPPCQSSSLITKGTNKGREYPDLIPATRKLLSSIRQPTVIENVVGSDIRRDIMLCGEMFNLGVLRHRYFEIDNIDIPQPQHIAHRGRVAGFRHGEWFTGPYMAVYGRGGGKGTVAEWQQAMDIHWTKKRKSIAEAIPPAYTEWIGNQIIQQLEAS